MKSIIPLVSIMIPNRNHSIYLGTCIESALNQTYDNTEIVVLDNCSNDNSMEIASGYIDQGVRLCKNPQNISNRSYKVLAMLTEGEYMLLLCADDLVKPRFIEKCVTLMEQNPNVGYVHCERDYIDTSGNIIDLDPFYKCSFISPGESALPIFMLTDVAQPSQCLMRRTAFDKILGYNTEFDHANADKELWFRLSLVSDYAYIRDKLSLIRIHEARESTLGFKRFFHPLAIYLTLDNQARLGEIEGHKNVLERLPAAYRKLASESILIAFSCLKENDRKLAKQYMLFSQIVNEDVINDDQYKKLLKTFNSPEITGRDVLQDTGNELFVRRHRNYDPPEGFNIIEV
jgi:glycosyltransferase involved in cell wall biosynthesis